MFFLFVFFRFALVCLRIYCHYVVHFNSSLLVYIVNTDVD